MIGASVARAWSCGVGRTLPSARPRERLEQQLGAESREARLQLGRGLLGADRRGAREQDRAGVEPVVDQHGGDARLRLAVDDRPLDRRRAAVAGQQRAVDVDGAAAAAMSMTAARQDLAVGDHHLDLGRERAQRLLRVGLLACGAGWRTRGRAPAPPASAAAAPTARPRPFSRSGCVTTAATSWPASEQRLEARGSRTRRCRGRRCASCVPTRSSQSSVRAFLRSLRFSRSRLSGVRRSTNSRPSMWSISWQKARASSSVPV